MTDMSSTKRQSQRFCSAHCPASPHLGPAGCALVEELRGVQEVSGRQRKQPVLLLNLTQDKYEETKPPKKTRSPPPPPPSLLHMLVLALLLTFFSLCTDCSFPSQITGDRETSADVEEALRFFFSLLHLPCLPSRT
eukprot:99118-Hanusia_phi.AAC.3